METIILSAIKTTTNENNIVVSAALQPHSRHCNIIHHLAKMGFLIPIKGEQGFITSTGRFVERAEAKKIAIDSGQIKETISSTLTSEDLW
jgi:hypothetical protein